MENRKFSEEELNRLVDMARPGYILTEKEAKVGLKNINDGGVISRKELNEIIERALLPVCPPTLPPSDILQVVDNYAYVFPVDPERPVKIVFEGEHMEEEEIINALYEKLKEISNENSKSD